MASSVSGPPSWNRTIPKHLAVCDIPTGSPESDRMLTRFSPARQTLLYKLNGGKHRCHSGKLHLVQLFNRQVVSDGEDDEFHSRRDASLVKNVAQVVFHGVLSNSEALRDFFVGSSGDNARNDLQLTFRESEVVRPGRLRRDMCSQVARQVLHWRRAYPGAATHHCLNRQNQLFRR